MLPLTGDVYLLLQRVGNAPSASAHAEFYETITLPEGGRPHPYPEADLAVDTCAPTRAYAAASGTYRDVGAQMNVVGGGVTLELLRFQRQSEIFYEPLERPRRMDAGISYDVDVPGAPGGATAWPAAVQLPAPIVPAGEVNGAVSVAPGQPLSLTWTPVGATEVSLYFFPQTASPTWRCRVQDDGQMTVPTEVITSLPAVSQMVIAAQIARPHSFAGGRLFARGQSESFVQINVRIDQP